jgi:hypothetical protein
MARQNAGPDGIIRLKSHGIGGRNTWPGEFPHMVKP